MYFDRPRSVGAALLALALLAAPVLADFHEEVAKLKRPSAREGVYIEKPENDVYFLQANGDRLLFKTREYQPMSNWGITDTALYVIDAKTGATVRRIETRHHQRVWVSPKGTYAACVESGGFRIHDVTTGQTVVDFQGKESPWYDVTWSPDESKLSFQGEYPTILKILDVKSQEVRIIRKNKFSQIYDHAWAPDSKTLTICEDATNILSQKNRTVKFLDGDFASPAFGEELREVSVDKSAIKKRISQVKWIDADTLLLWGQEPFQEAVLDLKSGKVLGGGTATSDTSFDSDCIYSYASAAGKTGDFQELFGKPNPRRNEPKQIPLYPAGRRSVIWERLDDELTMFREDFRHSDLSLIADRTGRPVIALGARGICHVSRVGNVLRAYENDGKFREYPLEAMAGE